MSGMFGPLRAQRLVQAAGRRFWCGLLGQHHAAVFDAEATRIGAIVAKRAAGRRRIWRGVIRRRFRALGRCVFLTTPCQRGQNVGEFLAALAWSVGAPGGLIGGWTAIERGRVGVHETVPLPAVSDRTAFWPHPPHVITARLCVHGPAMQPAGQSGKAGYTGEMGIAAVGARQFLPNLRQVLAQLGRLFRLRKLDRRNLVCDLEDIMTSAISSASAIPPYASQADPARQPPQRSEAPVAPTPRQPEAPPVAVKRASADPVVIPSRELEQDISPARHGGGFVIDLVIPPNGIPFARIFGGDDRPPAVDVKA
jgi:hypothetical protein